MSYHELRDNVVYLLEDLLKDHMNVNDALLAVAVQYGITIKLLRDMYTEVRGCHPEDFVQCEVEVIRD